MVPDALYCTSTRMCPWAFLVRAFTEVLDDQAATPASRFSMRLGNWLFFVVCG